MLAILRYIGWVKDYNQIFELRAGLTGSREKSGLGWHYEPEKKLCTIWQICPEFGK